MARRTKAEAQATRNALIDAAERLFDSQGVSRTSLQDIAQAAGATRGAIYWHFKDKADLFNAMMERATAHLDDMAQQTPDAEAAPDMQGYVDGTGSHPLKAPLALAGVPVANLFASTSGSDRRVRRPCPEGASAGQCTRARTKAPSRSWVSTARCPCTRTPPTARITKVL